MKNMDLVISCDTAIAHLAGAVGVASVDRAAVGPGLALAAETRGLPLVSHHAAVSPIALRKLG